MIPTGGSRWQRVCDPSQSGHTCAAPRCKQTKPERKRKTFKRWVRGTVGSLLAMLALTLPPVSAASPSPVGELPTRVAQPAIEVLEQETVSDFPDSLTFRLRARSREGDIVSATLFYRLGWDDTLTLARPAPFTPAPEVALGYTWDTGNQTVPPFIQITYHWQLIDSAGNVLITNPAQIEYTDRTHDWRSLRDERVVVYWYDRPDAFGQALFQAAVESYDHVARITGAGTPGPARVVIYNSQADFCVFYARDACQPWVGGQTFSGLTVQWGNDLDWFTYDVIPHELAHVFYGEIFRNTGVRVPTWFNEGIAVYNERSDHSREMAMVRQAAAEGDLIPLRLMGGRGGSVVHGQVGLWYAEAYTLVAFIADTYGEAKLGEVILTLAANTPIEEALRQTLGLDLVAYEMAWRAWLGYPVDSIPTPITLPTLEVTPYPLPTGARGPRPTDTPSSTPTPAEHPQDVAPAPTPPPPSRVACLPFGAVLLGALAWGVKRDA